ncbi:hypothetical protein, partial [uncultured Oscillibacter sp.]|uniref:hypothetical protein n=1 Tax=uncultured Oscillibacter sp. TaxID=876091 RepID=UPI0026369DAA
ADDGHGFVPQRGQIFLKFHQNRSLSFPPSGGGFRKSRLYFTTGTPFRQDLSAEENCDILSGRKRKEIHDGTAVF